MPAKKKTRDKDQSQSINDKKEQSISPVEEKKEEEKQEVKPINEKLTALDPNQPINKQVQGFKDKEFSEKTFPTDMLQIFLKVEGTLQTKDSVLYKQEETTKKVYLAQAEELIGKESAKEERTMKIAVFNKFRQCSRSAQAAQPTIIDIGGCTKTPESEEIKGSILLADIQDRYEIMREQYVEAEKRKIMDERGKEPYKPPVKKNQDVLYSDELRLALNKMFRQLLFNDKRNEYADLKYFFIDHAAKENMTNLPLLRYCYKRTDAKHSKTSQMITGIVWNPLYKDMFAVSVGSQEQEPQNIGHVQVYSLKNYKQPEQKIQTHSGVMCLDFNVNEPQMLCIGCQDGSVLVYDIRDKFSKPQQRSSMKSGKHNDPVWQIRWDPDKGTKTFYTVSSDGKLCSWSLVKSKLECEVIMMLKLEEETEAEDAGVIDVIELYNRYVPGNSATENYDSSISRQAAATCFDFCPKDNDREFLIGTEEGTIHKCSKSQTGTYLKTQRGHSLPVQNVDWNANHTHTFISCSADFTVKLWHAEKTTPVMNFTLDGSVVDVQWSPLSSLIFSAIDNTGYIYFFNLKADENKQVTKDSYLSTVKSSASSGQRDVRLTRLSFNEEQKILLVADDTGGLNVQLPHPKLLVTSDEEEGKKKKGNEEEKEKLDLTGKTLNIPGVSLNRITRRKKVEDDAGGSPTDLTTRDKEVADMNKFLKKLEKHNQVIEEKKE